MAHRRTFRGRGISDSQRRKKTWIAVKEQTGATGALQSFFRTSISMNVAATGSVNGDSQSATFGLIDVGSAPGGDEFSMLPEESTILRIRGTLDFPKNVKGSIAQVVNAQYLWGIGVTDIRGIVNGANPLPITDSDWDGWMLLRGGTLPPLDATGTILDIKSMRKLKTGDALFIAVQSVNGASVIAPAAEWFFDLRLLILLP